MVISDRYAEIIAKLGLVIAAQQEQRKESLNQREILEEHGKILREHGRMFQEHKEMLQEHGKILQERMEAVAHMEGQLSSWLFIGSSPWMPISLSRYICMTRGNSTPNLWRGKKDCSALVHSSRKQGRET